MKKIHMIGNTHFDPVWLWRWDEGLASIRATFRAALARMDEDADFVYSFSAPAVLSMIEEVDPALFADIRRRVEEGRWELSEGWWLQADCLTPCGESFVRQGLYGQKYLQERFGRRSLSAFNVDSFGHNANLPQLLVGCGIRNYAFWRPDEAAYHLPEPFFTWEGIDGTRVTAVRTHNYFDPDMEERVLLPLLARAERGEERQNTLCQIFGVTDHGGAPTKRDMATIRRYAERGVWFSRVDDMFDAAREESLPTVRGELPVHFIGPAINHSTVKRCNRLAEEKLQRAEAAATLAWYLTGRDYPRAALRSAWQDVLFHQFHDILGGTCLPSADLDTRNGQGRAMQTADEITHFSLQTLSSRMQMPGKNPDNVWNLVLFNLNGKDGKTYIEAELQWAWEFPWYREGIVLVDADGNEYPTEIIREECVLPGFRTRILFAADMPAYGWRTFAILQKGKRPPFPAANHRRSVRVGGYRMTAEREGGVRLETPDGRVYSRLFTPFLQEDICDTWGFNDDKPAREKRSFRRTEVSVIEEGRMRAALRTVCHYGHSEIEETFYLYEDGRVECRFRTLFHEKQMLLSLAFPGNAPTVTTQIPYGYTERTASYHAKAAGSWLLSGDAGVVYDSVFGYFYDGREVSLSLLRTAIYGDLRNEPLEARADYTYLDRGVAEGRLCAFFDSPTPARLTAEAAALCRPVTVVEEACHDGELPSEMTCVYTDGDSPVVTAMKLAEDADRIVLRCVETAGGDSRATVKMFDRARRYSFRPFEIKTLVNMEERNLLEETLAEDAT